MLAYKRTQIWLEPKQHTELTNLAAEESRSLSEIVREMVTDFLAKRAAEKRKKTALESLGRLTAFRKELASRSTEPLPDPVDMLNEMRDERMADFERIWRGEE